MKTHRVFLCGLVFGLVTLVAVAAHGADPTPFIVRNPDPLSSNATNRQSLTGVIYANGKFTAVGPGSLSGQGPCVAAQSTDGAGWSFTGYTVYWPYFLEELTYANGLYVGVGGFDLGNIDTSPDGVNWTLGGVGSDHSAYHGVTCGLYGFIAVGFGEGQAGWPYTNRTAIAASADGLSWTICPSPFTAAVCLNAVTSRGSGTYVAVGDKGAIIRCSAGSFPTNWTVIQPATVAYSLNDVIYAGDKYVAVGSAGVIRNSTSGSSWIDAPSSLTSNLNAVAYGNGTYLAVGDGGTMVISTNATTWTRIESGTQERLLDVAYGNGSFVVVGCNGIILQSRSFRPSVAGRRTGEGFELNVTGGEQNVVHRLQSAADVNFATPTTLGFYSNTNEATLFQDTNALSQPCRFYRVVSP